MAQGVAAMIEMLKRMTPGELRRKYEETFGEPCRSFNKDWLWKRIAWRIQANAEGGLSERALRRARELAREADLRLRPPRAFLDGGNGDAAATTTQRVPRRRHVDRRLPPVGSTIVRDYRGQRVEVTVLERGFEYQGVPYRTLSAVAEAVTGSHWNGYLFFGLDGNGRGNRRRKGSE
ncbi:MAG TPA: DUF2924 domain-containing protein [Planctomycetota bacterium]|nr:DUF2924 domain-containing protein [Planctomycetota bacterium]